jgi:RNA polymerase sigma factor (sigma-70 family)
VYSYAYYELRDQHEAEDATERTFMAALTNLNRFEERATPADGTGASTFRVWLFQIARNAVANQRRGRRRHPQAPLEAAALVADPLDIEGGATIRDEAAAAWQAVGRLPADRRRAVVLRFVEEMSTAEIADSSRNVGARSCRIQQSRPDPAPLAMSRVDFHEQGTPGSRFFHEHAPL